MNKEELDNKLKDLVKQTLEFSETARDLSNEGRNLELQRMALEKALADLKAGKPENEVLAELDSTITDWYTKITGELKAELEFEQKAEEQALSQEAKSATDDEASQDK